LRAAAPARLAKDFLVGDAMTVGTPNGWMGMTCAIRVARGYVAHRAPSTRRTGALFHSSGTLDPPQGVEGTSTRLHGHERAGDGVSPVARQSESISPESLEETWRSHRVVAE
jgi:hypothetical protein